MKKDVMRDDCKRMKTRGPNHECGFTLLETAIAFTIMLVVGLGASSLFLYANSYNSGATDHALANAVAKQQMEQLRNVSFTDASLTVPTGNTSTTSTSTVSDGGKNYSVTKTVELLTAPCTGCAQTKRITITITPQDRNPSWGANPVTLVTLRSAIGAGPYIK